MNSLMRNLLGNELYTDADALTFTAVSGDATISLAIKKGSPTTSGLQYMLDGDLEWNDYTPGETLSLDEGTSVKFKNTATTLNFNAQNYVGFTGTGKTKASGTVQSMLNYIDEVPDGGFMGLFNGYTPLVKAPKLTAKKVGDNGYNGMFVGCSSLIQAPEIYATIVGDNACNAMFNRCTSLVKAPSILPAKKIGYRSYYRMFRGTSIIEPPKILANEFTGAEAMREMFLECENLTKSPELYTKRLTDLCYYGTFKQCHNLTETGKIHAEYQAPSSCQSMFWQCTSLSAAPALSSTHLALECYHWMFEECSGLIIPPELPATTLAPYCYHHMFTKCVNLQYAPELPALEVPEGAYCVMFKWSGIKDMPELPATKYGLAACYSMFCYCDALTGVLDTLPATDISDGTYTQMFFGCTSLKDAPELPSATITSGTTIFGEDYGAYEKMFYQCSSLSSITVNFETWNNKDTKDWVTSVPAGGKFYCPAALSAEYGVNRIPTGWEKVDK